MITRQRKDAIRRQISQLVSPLVWLQLFILHSMVIHSLSISSPASNSKNIIASSTTVSARSNNQINIQLPYQQQALSTQATGQQQQQQQITTLPPLITTIISQNNYPENYSEQQQTQSKVVAPETPSAHSGQELRSSSVDEHDDTVPLATVNNHSRNNQPAPRPPQYVDVSALRDRNMTSVTSPSSIANSFSSVSGGTMTTPGLSAKSRSGLPECATQQVCNAIFVRMNYTQKLCECSSNYNWKCSHNLDPQDGHTIELTRKFDKRIYTQIKTCEPLREVRACKSPTDWTLLALQSERSGKAHYVVVCKCPTWAQLEGPYTHNHPPYANIPGIRVYGMLCAHQTARSSAQTYSAYNPALNIYPEFPWSEALNVLNTTNLLPTLNSY